MKDQRDNINAQHDDIIEDDHDFDGRGTIERGSGGSLKMLITIAIFCAGGAFAWWKFGDNYSNIYNTVRGDKNPPLQKDSTNVTTEAEKHEYIQTQQNITNSPMTVNPTPSDAIMPLNPVPDLGQLPNWDLSDIYKSLDDAKIVIDITRVTKDSIQFLNEFRGKVAKLDSNSLLAAIKRYEDILERIGRLGSFASLNMAIDSTNENNKSLASSINIKASEIGSRLAFFALELSKINQKKLDIMYKQSPALSKYSSFLYDISRFKSHMLSEDVEQYSSRHSLINDSWSDLFDEIWSRMRFQINGKSLTSEEVVTIYQTNTDRSQRAAAAHEMENGIKNNSYLFSFITNTLARYKSIEDSIRSYGNPMSYRNLSNNIEDSTVNMMISTVKSRYKDTSHRYYQIKAKLLGLPKLAYYDRSAPLSLSGTKSYQWNDAKEIVLSSYNAFSPKMGQIAEQFFTKKWIDAPVTPNKRGGAFCAGVSPSLHPYILVNYLGKSRDVSTLAHELGHGIHDVLASQHGYLTTQPPLTLAETASIFGEELVFSELLKRTTDRNEKISLLASKIEDSIATIISQVAYAEFEGRVHEAIKTQNNLTMETMNEMWISAQRDALGDAFDLDGYQYHWMRIPHFIHTPFYVYSYTFGNLLVNSLYNTYTSKKVSNFEDKYMVLLASGGTKSYSELLKPFGLDATTPQFWNSGIDVLVARIDEFEKLVSQPSTTEQSQNTIPNPETKNSAETNPNTMPQDQSQKQSGEQINGNSGQSNQGLSTQNQNVPPSDAIVPPRIPKI